MNRAIGITDHAVLRFLERNAGMDIESIRQLLAEQAMNDPRTRKRIDEFGDAPYKIKKEGVTFCMKGKVMTTLYPTRKKKTKLSDRRKK